MAWINDDGLKVKFDVEKVDEQSHRGEAPGAGTEREIVVSKRLSEIATGVVYAFDNVIIPRNSVITEVAVTNLTVLAGGTNIDVGLQELNYTDEYDYDGLLVDYATLTVGQKSIFVQGTSGHGALVGEKTTKPGVLTITPNGTFTGDSLVQISVKVHVPGKDPLPRVWE